MWYNTGRAALFGTQAELLYLVHGRAALFGTQAELHYLVHRQSCTIWYTGRAALCGTTQVELLAAALTGMPLSYHERGSAIRASCAVPCMRARSACVQCVHVCTIAYTRTLALHARSHALHALHARMHDLTCTCARTHTQTHAHMLARACAKGCTCVSAQTSNNRSAYCQKKFCTLLGYLGTHLHMTCLLTD